MLNYLKVCGLVLAVLFGAVWLLDSFGANDVVSAQLGAGLGWGCLYMSVILFLVAKRTRTRTVEVLRHATDASKLPLGTWKVSMHEGHTVFRSTRCLVHRDGEKTELRFVAGIPTKALDDRKRFSVVDTDEGRIVTTVERAGEQEATTATVRMPA